MSIEGVTLSAGGKKGYIHLGVLSVLIGEVGSDRIRLWAGTSIGALISFLVMLGLSPERIIEYFIKNGEPVLSPTLNLKTLVSRFGLIDMQQLSDMVEQILDYGGLDKRLVDLTFEQAFDLTGKHLMVCAVNLDESRAEYFTTVDTPNVKCMDAVLASCCIPGIFQTRQIDNKTYIDGGRLDAFPKVRAELYFKAHLADSKKQDLGETQKHTDPGSDAIVFGVNIHKLPHGPVTNLGVFIYRILTAGNPPPSREDPHTLVIDDGEITNGRILYQNGMKECQQYFS